MKLPLLIQVVVLVLVTSGYTLRADSGKLETLDGEYHEVRENRSGAGVEADADAEANKVVLPTDRADTAKDAAEVKAHETEADATRADE